MNAPRREADPDPEDAGRLIERKLALRDELEGLEAERRRLARRASWVFTPAFALVCSVPLLWDLPAWAFVALALVLVGGPLLYVLRTEEGRKSRESWRRIQRLRRELAFLESFGHLTEADRELLGP